MLCDKAAEPKLYRPKSLGGGSTVSDAIVAGSNPTPASKTCDALSKKRAAAGPLRRKAADYLSHFSAAAAVA